MAEISIRHAKPSDLTKMIEVEVSAAKVFSSLPQAFLQNLPAEFPPQSDNFYEKIIASNLAWVICVDEEIAGFILTEKVPGENTLHIHEFDVAHSFQGKGLGTKLMQHVLDFGCKKGIARFTLRTFKTVAWNAPFYEKFGFVMMSEEAEGHRLRALLQAEIEMGLPKEMRCAMERCRK